VPSRARDVLSRAHGLYHSHHHDQRITTVFVWSYSYNQPFRGCGMTEERHKKKTHYYSRSNDCPTTMKVVSHDSHRTHYSKFYLFTFVSARKE
jgi:hypothetical protein